MVDDEAEVRTAVRHGLELMGYEIEVASDGIEGVSKVEAWRPDVVLLDLAMPGVRGFSGLIYLRAQHPSVPIVIVSANDDPNVIRRCIGLGASGFVPKTLAVEVMRRAIRCVLEGGVWTPPDVDMVAGADAET